MARLRFEVPPEPTEQGDEERNLIVEIQEWFAQYQESFRKEGEDRGRVAVFTRQFERRLGRPLAESERRVLAERLARLGEDRVDNVVLGFTGEALAAWLVDPAAS